MLIFKSQGMVVKRSYLPEISAVKAEMDEKL